MIKPIRYLLVYGDGTMMPFMREPEVVASQRAFVLSHTTTVEDIINWIADGYKSTLKIMDVQDFIQLPTEDEV